MVRSLVLLALVASAIGLVWHALGQPVPMPPSPLAPGEKLTCVSYTPFHGDQDPFELPDIPDEQIADDMERLAGITSCVRTYAASGPERRVPEYASRHGIKVLQGIWLSRDPVQSRREVEAALDLARRYPGVIDALIVGNEAVLRGELSPEQVAAYLEEVRTRSHLPVTYADVWEFWLEMPELAEATDFVTIHILPYWEDHPVAAEDAVAHVRKARQRIAAAFPGKDILIGEVGWPSAGRMRDQALPSPANQARVLSEVVETAQREGWKINLIEAFDQPWKRRLEGTVGGFWGIFDNVEREPKFRFGMPVSNHPQWRLVAGLGIGAAFLVFLSAWLGGAGRSWLKDVAVAVMALASGLVFGWATLRLSQTDVFLGDQVKGAAMLALALVVPMAAAFALGRGDRLHGFATALNLPPWRRGDLVVAPVLAALFAATVAVAMSAGLGLVFDPRYKDFPVALLTGPVAAFAILAVVNRNAPPRPGVAEFIAAAILAGSALFIVVNEEIVNWQAVWFGLLLAVLALTVLQVRNARG